MNSGYRDCQNQKVSMSVEVECALLTIDSDPEVATHKLTISDVSAGEVIIKQGEAHRADDGRASLKNMA